MAGKMFALALALVAAGCSDAAQYEDKVGAAPDQSGPANAQATADEGAKSGETTSSSASASTSVTDGGARAIAVNSDLMEFSYAYPAAAGAIPELRAMLDARLKDAQAEITRQASEAQADAKANGYPYRQHSLTIDWQVVANVPGFLSLSEHIGEYSGGAHGNYGTGGLVWDRKAAKALKAADLFTSPAALEKSVRSPYCKALDAERLKRRGEVTDPDEVFGNCPKLEELTVLLGSTNRRTFNRIGLIADPYVAGAYAEGDFEVTLPVTDAVLKAVKPEFRAAFSKGG